MSTEHRPQFLIEVENDTLFTLWQDWAIGVLKEYGLKITKEFSLALNEAHFSVTDQTKEKYTPLVQTMLIKREGDLKPKAFWLEGKSFGNSIESKRSAALAYCQVTCGFFNTEIEGGSDTEKLENMTQEFYKIFNDKSNYL